jgi:hypothetical protein
MELLVTRLPEPASKTGRVTRAALLLLVSSLAVFAVAFALRRAFFWDIKPVSWDNPPPQNGALEAAFLLLSIENVAAIVAAIALVFGLMSWWRSRAKS